MKTSIHDISEVNNLARKMQVNPHQLRGVRNAFYKHHETWPDSCRTIIHNSTNDNFLSQINTSFLTLQSAHHSELDGATKLIFKLNRSEQFIETVILRNQTGRTSLCVSSQVGCAADCAFCATGKMKLRGQLTRDEILDQIIRANQFLRKENRQVRNVVFMGMGEPFHNETAVFNAIELLTSPKCFDLPQRNILISTVGIPDAMIRFTQSYPRAGLALSLHSVDQKTRESIIPIAAKHPLNDLQKAIHQITEISSRPPMIEWLMLRNINDSPTNARNLSQYLKDTNAHINLIPYNTIADAPHLAASNPQTITRFAEELRHAGYTVTTRRSLGSDITAACGQLADHTESITRTPPQPINIQFKKNDQSECSLK